MSVRETIVKQLAENPIVLYMKGTPTFPQCGFSSKVVNILRECGAEFMPVNILENEEIRQGIKEYGNWPTIPQLYVNGELIGGSDIIQVLYDSGELQKILLKSPA
jgi:monothiol glutaredoxin